MKNKLKYKILLISNYFKTYVTVGGALGIAYAASGLSQFLVRDNEQYQLFPNGTVPIAAFLTAPTKRMPEVNATSLSFAETADESGYLKYGSLYCVRNILMVVKHNDSMNVNILIYF